MSGHPSALLEQVLDRLANQAFRTDDLDHLPDDIREVIGEVTADLDDASVSSDALHARVDALAASGRLSPPRAQSLHAVVDLHPQRLDHTAARAAIERMAIALRDEPDAAERRRGAEAFERLSGAVCFLDDRSADALEHYLRAFELRPSGSNASNVLAALIDLGRLDDARTSYLRFRAGLTPSAAAVLDARVTHDPDLLPLQLLTDLPTEARP